MFRPLRFAILAWTISLLVPLVLYAQDEVVVPDGTPIRLIATEPVTFASARVGSTVQWNVAENVTVGNYIVVRKGALAEGIVEVLFDFGSTPRVQVRLKTVRVSTGELAPIRSGPQKNDQLVFNSKGIISHTRNNLAVAEGEELPAYFDGTAVLDASVLQAQGDIIGAPRPVNRREVVTLADGTPVYVKVGQTVTTEDAEVGQRVYLDVARDVFVGNTVVIPRWSTAWATVSEVHGKMGRKKPGGLSLKVDSVRTNTGQKILLRSQQHTGADTSGAPPEIEGISSKVERAPTEWIYIQGDRPVIEKETSAIAYVDGNYTLEIPSELSQRMTASIRRATPGITTIPIMVVSTPSDAEVYIDSHRVGKTPTPAAIIPGDHTILVKKAGYEDWQRDVTVAAGGITVEAELDKK